jgi:hypothetical protein
MKSMMPMMMDADDAAFDDDIRMNDVSTSPSPPPPPPLPPPAPPSHIHASVASRARPAQERTFHLTDCAYPVDRAPDFFTVDGRKDAKDANAATEVCSILRENKQATRVVMLRACMDIARYCRDMRVACMSTLETRRLDAFPREVLATHTRGMQTWLCHRYNDAAPLVNEKQKLSLAAGVGMTRLWLLYVDQALKLYTCTERSTERVGLEYVDVYDLVFTADLFRDDTRYARDPYNPLTCERLAKRHECLPQLAQQYKRELAEKRAIGARANAAAEKELDGMLRSMPDVAAAMDAGSVLGRAAARLPLSDADREKCGIVERLFRPTVPGGATPCAAEATNEAAEARAARAVSEAAPAPPPPPAAAPNDWKAFVATYVPPRASYAFRNTFQTRADTEACVALGRIMDALVRKMALGSLYVLPHLHEPHEWRALLHVLDVTCMVLLLQMCATTPPLYARMEAYTRWSTWVHINLALLDTFRLEVIDFKPETEARVRAFMDHQFSVTPDASMTSKTNVFMYEHYMCGGTFYAMLQQDRQMSDKVPPMNAARTQLTPDEQAFLNDQLVTTNAVILYKSDGRCRDAAATVGAPKTSGVARDDDDDDDDDDIDIDMCDVTRAPAATPAPPPPPSAAHPFNHIFTLLAFGTIAGYQYQGLLPWNARYVTTNFALIRSLARILSPYTEGEGRHARPQTINIFGAWYELSHWAACGSPPNAHRLPPLVERPTRFLCADPIRHIATKLFLLRHDFNYTLECNLSIRHWTEGFFAFEAPVTYAS